MTTYLNASSKFDGDLTMIYYKDNTNMEYIDGLITNENNDIICSGLNKVKRINTDETSFEDFENINFFENNEFKHLKQHLMIDGTIIRLFNHGGKWIKSTNKMINAYKAYWENKKSFGEMFDEASYDLNYGLLDTSLTYFFIMQHPENRIIKKIDKPDLFLIGAFDTSGYEKQVIISGIKRQQKISFNSLKEIYDFVKNENLHWETPGIIISTDNISFRIFLENPVYNKVKQIKNTMKFNTQFWKIKSNVKQSSCRLVKIILENKDIDFITYFPEERDEIVEIKQKIENVINETFSTYRKCHMYKTEMYDETYKYFLFVRNVHNNYLATQENITREKVKEIFYKQSISLVLTLLELIDLKK